MVGIIDDQTKTCTQYFKNKGDIIALIGLLKEELGASEYLRKMHNMTKGAAPSLDLNLERAVQRAVLEAIKKGLINSAHDCSEGGLAVALAECCISNSDAMLGAVVKLSYTKNMRKDAILFGETNSRIIVSLNKADVASLERIAKRHKAPCQIIGAVGADKLIIECNKIPAIDIPIDTLSKNYREAIPAMLQE
jgi:phosphoribosylformylglycinamidine synthase subunit PurL